MRCLHGAREHGTLGGAVRRAVSVSTAASNASQIFIALCRIRPSRHGCTRGPRLVNAESDNDGQKAEISIYVSVEKKLKGNDPVQNAYD